MPFCPTLNIFHYCPRLPPWRNIYSNIWYFHIKTNVQTNAMLSKFKRAKKSDFCAKVWIWDFSASKCVNYNIIPYIFLYNGNKINVMNLIMIDLDHFLQFMLVYWLHLISSQAHFLCIILLSIKFLILVWISPKLVWI